MGNIRRLRNWLKQKRGVALAEISTLDAERRITELANAVLAVGGRDQRSIAGAVFAEPISVHVDEGVVDGCERAVDTSGADQFTMLREARPSLNNNRLLDFGCGLAADHRAGAEQAGYEWRGLEVADTRDPITRVGLRERAKDPRLELYDGGAIPFSDASFDAVFSNQSLEHVHDIDLAMREIARVLVPGGVLVGSVSHLEPFHGFSTFNYTPYGFAMVGRRHGLKLERITAGIDALTLITRALLCQLGQGAPIDRIFEVPASSSPLNELIDEVCRRTRKGADTAAKMKLNFCAQFRFQFRRVEGADAHTTH